MHFDRGGRRKIKVALDMTPMIDVVLLLLFFFMLTSTFALQSSIPIEVAQAEGEPVLDQKDLSVTLAYGEGGPDNAGPVYVDNLPVQSWGELTQMLSDAHAEREDVLVLIRPDARIPTERLVRVLGIAGSVGIERYGIQAQPPEMKE